MRKVMVLLALPLVACGMKGADDRPGIAGSGSGNARSYQVADFDAIELAGADDVDVRVGTGFSVRAEGPAEDLDGLRIRKEGRSLSIGRRHDGLHWGRGGKVRVYVTVPRLTAASVAGSGNLTVDRVEGVSFKGSLAGSGDLKLGTAAIDETNFEVAGSGSIQASGTTRQLKVSIAGSGDIDAPELAASAADISIAGSGGVKARVNGAAKVSIMGSGDVDLGPGARCQTSKMGSGNVRCG